MDEYASKPFFFFLFFFLRQVCPELLEMFHLATDIIQVIQAADEPMKRASTRLDVSLCAYMRRMFHSIRL
jgi:hypothetical protein